ncbi:Uncharacterised protein [uncultured archaeon]|nr:Uncharacterised protein [uncultured archaeon]
MQSVLDGLRQPRAVLDRVQPVHDHLDVMLLVAVQLNFLVRAANFSIHPHPGKAFGIQIRNELAVGSFLLADHRREDSHLPAARGFAIL